MMDRNRFLLLFSLSMFLVLNFFCIKVVSDLAETGVYRVEELRNDCIYAALATILIICVAEYVGYLRRRKKQRKKHALTEQD